MKRYDIESYPSVCSDVSGDWEAIESKDGKFTRYADIAAIIYQIKDSLYVAKEADEGRYSSYNQYAQGCADAYQEILEMLEGE